jgi:DNA-binding CsgD family transcriptional regulator
MDILGREPELQTIEAFLDGDAPRALLLEGSAGIGKTTLWRAAVELAREPGIAVFTCSPSAAEADIGFAALGDLLADVDDELLESLPAPHRQALETALLRTEAERPPEGRALALGVVRVLQTIADNRRLVVAIDDVQWLDLSSRQALTFAVRRLEDHPIHWLIARRQAEGHVEPPLDLERTFPPERFDTCPIGPLSVGALGRMIRQRLDVDLRRPAMLQLQAASGGNPFFALELAATLSHDTSPPGLPASLAEAVDGRLHDLEGATFDALLVAAVSPAPTLAEIDEVAGVDAWAALGPARTRGIIENEGDVVAFTHPLYSAAVLARADPRKRADVHRRLANRARGPELRAHHLAAGTEEPDESVAAEIELGARDAYLRGAPEIGARLAARARELTRDANVARTLGLLEAECLYAAGDVERGRALLTQLSASTAPGPARAEILYRLARTPRNFVESVELCEQALVDAVANPELASEIAITLSTSLFLTGDTDRAAVQIREAIAIADAANHTVVAWRARSVLAMMDGVRGNGWDIETMRRAAEVDLEYAGRPRPDSAGLWLVQALHFNDLVEEAHERTVQLRAQALSAGEAMAAAQLVAHLATIDIRGRFANAREYALQAIEECEQIGWDQTLGEALELLALAEAWLGNEDEARAAAERGVGITRTGAEQLGEARYLSALLVLEAGLEHWQEAAALAEEGFAASGTMLTSADTNPFFGLGVEAHAAVGNLGRAEELTEKLELEAAARPTPYLRTIALRCRGVVDAATGNLEEAAASLRAAADAAAELDAPHERGRTLLLLGRVQRRAGQKAEARATLQTAAELLDGVGAKLFANQARAELGRIAGRRAGRSDELTEAERRIAALVAEGRSNKEVAATLFVTVKTVEVTLTRVYRKLGVKNRAELAARFAELAKH